MKKILLVLPVLLLNVSNLYAQNAEIPASQSNETVSNTTVSEETTGSSNNLSLPEEEAGQVASQEPAVTTETPAATTPQAPSTDVKYVKAIDVQGNKSISLTTILSKIKTRVGQEYLQNIVSEDLKRLYNTGYFSDVRVDHIEHDGGFKVIIYLTEKPIIDEITFSKTRTIASRTLIRKLKSHVKGFLDNKDLKDDENTIKDLYAKKGLTSAKVEVETFVDDATNKASLHFVINEGYRIRIKRINIVGNHAFKRNKILNVVKTHARNLFNSGYLKDDVLQEDMERVASFYEQQGYIDAQATYEIEQLYKGNINVNVTINEGKRYYVGHVAIVGNDVISEKEIRKAMTKITEGNVFSREKLSVDISDIRTLYFDRGYIFADIKESTSLEPTTGKVDVKLDVTEGVLAYIEKIKIQGNTRTRDIVIRRELKLYPGDRFDGSKLRRSKERLNDLGYFDDVSFDMEDTDADDRKDLVVQVKEAKTGTFSFGGGYSTVDQLVGFIEIEQRNFDFANWPSFTGGGQNLQLRAETGSTRNNLRLSFTEPWIFDYPVSGGFDAYLSERNRERDIGYAYDEKRAGGDIRFGKDFNENLSAGASYRLENVKISNLESGVSADLAAEEGRNTISSVGFNIAEDFRDSKLSPTNGLFVGADFDVAGSIFGGDKNFLRAQFNGSYDIPLAFKSVLEFRGRTGFVNEQGDTEKVPIFERFFAGGARSIRGYNERKVGPLDPANNDPIGGETMLVGNIELTVPVIDFVKVAAFYDTGNVGAEIEDYAKGGFKSGMGLGLRVKTPVGPINLDYGYPLNKEGGEDSRSGKFYFSVSRGF